jgi:murein DD-endopeptidase MepM/ murein hydrolase activator NlpD
VRIRFFRLGAELLSWRVSSPGIRPYLTCFLIFAFASISEARSERNVYIVASTTRIHLPRDYQWQQPERRYAEAGGARLDLYSRSFQAGDAVYAEIRLPEKAGTSFLMLDGVTLPLTKTSFGYRTFFAIPSNFMAKHMELQWTVPELKSTRYLALRPRSTTWPVSKYYRRVDTQASRKLTEREEQRLKEKQAAFERKIAEERRIKAAAFALRSPDLIGTSISHPRDMHYITSSIFVRRMQILYTIENNRRKELGRYTIIHNGVDLGGRIGSPIFAMLDGRVVLAQHMHYEGNYTVIDHGNGIFTGYMHQSKIHVRPGQVVRAGDFIGEVGSTGFSTGPHLHATLTIRGVVADPLSLLVLPIRN